MAQTIAKVALFGGVSIDVKWQATDQFYSGSSSQGMMSEHFGGVARNVAESLARLNVSVGLVSLVGNDRNGCRLVTHLEQLHIDTSYLKQSVVYPTATYCGFHHKNGELNTALVDLRIYDECRGHWFKSAIEYYRDARIHLLDTDLPVEAISLVVGDAQAEIWAVVTALFAASKLEVFLPKIHALFLNLKELRALVKSASISLAEATGLILRKGVKFVVVTLGKNGVYFASRKLTLYLPAEKIPVVDVTGAGDALLSAYLAAYLSGFPAEDCLNFGIKAASLTLKTNESVSPNLSEIASAIHERVTELP